jgi:hypothetical protein
VPSSVIRDYSYDTSARRLDITFVTGRRYAYLGVPPALVASFDRAISKGGFFNRRIRDHFRFIRRRG